MFEGRFGYRSGKVYEHNVGLSCCFRQWRAASHCNQLHGYALKVAFEFERYDFGLNDQNWVQDYGGLKPIKQYLEDMFDHKTLVALDDPELETFRKLEEKGLVSLIFLEHVGCEAFARTIFGACSGLLGLDPVDLRQVTVWEHAANWASYGRVS